MNKKVLIIDDEVDFGFLMKRFFTIRHYDVFLAYTLADGIRLMEEQNPDYIFLDNNLPDGLGWSKTEFILLNYPQAQLNLMSALTTPKTLNAAYRVFEKPIPMEDLTRMFG